MTRNMMDYATVIAVGELVKLHCQSTPSGAVYDPNWSDARIATEIGGVTEANVYGIRTRLCGKIYKPKPNDLAELHQRLEALELWASQRPKCPYSKV